MQALLDLPATKRPAWQLRETGAVHTLSYSYSSALLQYSKSYSTGSLPEDSSAGHVQYATAVAGVFPKVLHNAAHDAKARDNPHQLQKQEGRQRRLCTACVNLTERQERSS
eukprot:394092-Pelagomonas_calceolata.AAC.2